MRHAAWGTIAGCVMVAAVAPACRQVAGVHERSSQMEVCSQCIDDSCGAEESACRASSSCASRLDCTTACDPTSANVLACQASCAAVSGDPTTLGAIDSCMATACHAQCQIVSGGVLPITPPESATACAKCVNAQCSAEATACTANVDCLRGLECARGQSTPDAIQTCPDVRFSAGSVAYHTFDDCVAGACSDDCAYGADWSCVGKVVVPVPTSDTLTGTLTLVNVTAQSQTLPGLDVVPCSATDTMCTTPLSPAVVSDAKGEAVVTLPVRVQGGRAPFTGYLQITDPTKTYADEVAFSFPGTTQPQSSITAIVATEGDAQLFATALGSTFDPTTGIVLVTAVDCANRPAPNVTMTLTVPGGGHPPFFYTQNGIPSQNPTQTDVNGTGLVPNVPPGVIGVSVRTVSPDRVVATGEVLTRALTGTLLRIAPTK